MSKVVFGELFPSTVVTRESDADVPFELEMSRTLWVK